MNGHEPLNKDHSLDFESLATGRLNTRRVDLSVWLTSTVRFELNLGGIT